MTTTVTMTMPMLTAMMLTKMAMAINHDDDDGGDDEMMIMKL